MGFISGFREGYGFEKKRWDLGHRGYTLDQVRVLYGTYKLPIGKPLELPARDSIGYLFGMYYHHLFKESFFKDSKMEQLEKDRQLWIEKGYLD
jgi:hypothetical protein